MQIRIILVLFFIVNSFLIGNISVQNKDDSNKIPNVLFIISDDHTKNALVHMDPDWLKLPLLQILIELPMKEY